jgi:glycosyltransferase involved in cell wall biosynthesis
MRILMLSGAYPLPADNGAKRRILATASHLAKNHDLTLVALEEANVPIIRSSEMRNLPWQENIVTVPAVPRWQTVTKSLFSRYSYSQVKCWHENFHSIVRELLTTQHFDSIWVHMLCMAPYLKHFSFNKKVKSQAKTKLILDQHNVDEMYYRSFLTSDTYVFWKLYAVWELLKAKRSQKQWYPQFDAILCVAPEDIGITSKYMDTRTNIWLAPNGVEIDYFRAVKRQDLTMQTNTIVFGASFDVSMNQDAACWFALNVFPIVEKQVPGVQFLIVGRNPSVTIQRLAERQSIKVIGTVPDIREYYRQASVFVVPVRIGGGTKLKTLEAMSMGLPIVSTTVGAQGLEVESGHHLYITDNPDTFAAHAVELLMDRNKAICMGAAARRLVEQKYSWTIIMNDLDIKLKNLCRE